MDWTDWKTSHPDINWGSSDLDDIKKAFSDFIKEEYIDDYLNNYNTVFDSKPIDLINKKDTDQIWEMIVNLAVGNFS